MARTIGVGSTLGDYEIVSVLGAGGAGNVFVAKDKRDGSKCALKVLRPETESVEEVQKRFVREIAVAQTFASPNVIKYFDCGLGEDGVLYYTMEHIKWGSLKDLLRVRRTLPWNEAVECSIQLADGLAHLHSKGVIHRDLKPDNVFLSDDGHLKLGDFGLVRASSLARLTLDGSTVGTAKYLAPEQARGVEQLDGRTDVYALGCNLFEMIAGRPPFTADSSTAGYVDLMKQHVEKTAPRLSDLVASIPTALDELVAEMLAKAPDDRPKSAAVTRDRLQAILDGRPQPMESDEEAAEPLPLTTRLKDQAGSEVNGVRTRSLLVVGLVLITAIVVFAAMKNRVP